MEQNNFNESNIMYRDAMNASRMGNEQQFRQRITDMRRDNQTNRNQHISNYSSGVAEDINQRHIRNLPSSLTSDRSAILKLEDNRSNVQNLDTLRNYQANTWKSPGASSWNEWNPRTSDLNTEITYSRPDVRLEHITSRNETDIRGVRDIFTATSSLMETERSLGNRSTASFGSPQMEQNFAFMPPSNYDLARNQRGIPNAFVRNETNRRHIPGENKFEPPGTNRNTFRRPWRNRKRKRNISVQVKNDNQKVPKIVDPLTVSLQRAAEVINVLMDENKRLKNMQSTAVLSGTSLATGQISGASATQPTVTPATPAKKKKKKRNKSKAAAQNPEVKDANDLKTAPLDMKSTAVLPGTSVATGQFSGARVVTQLSATAAKKKKNVKNKIKVEKVKNAKRKKTAKDLKFLLAILPRNYPMQKMAPEQLPLLKDALVEGVGKMIDKSLIPRFASCYSLLGFVMVYWKSDNGVECLNKVVKTLKPWDGASFKVIQQHPPNFTWTAIVANEFPNKCMTFEQVLAVFAALSNKMDEIPVEEHPQFIDAHFARGIILVAYTKQKDFEWLKNAIQDLQPWEGAQFRLLDIDDVPVYSKIELNLPFPVDDFEAMVARLGRQNQGLDTSDWHLFERRIKNDGRQLLVSVKDDVIESLEKIDYKLFLNLNRITVTNLGKIKKVPYGASTYEDVLRNLKRVKTRLDQPKPDETPVAQAEPVDDDEEVVE